MDFPQLLTIKEASEALKVHPNTLRLWEKEGLITSYRVGGKRFKRYKKEDILRLFEKREKQNFLDPNQEVEFFYYKSLIHSAFVAIVAQTLNGVVTTWNRSAEQLYGYSAKEAVGKRISFFVSAGSKEQFGEIVQLIKKDQCFGPYKATITLRNGKQLAIIVTHSPIKDKAGAVVGITTIARDIAQEEKAEESIYRSEERFRLVVEHSIDLIAFFDETMRYQYVSPSHARVLGYNPQDLLQHKLPEIVHPEDMSAVLEEQRKSMRGEPISPIEFRLRRKDGSWITAEGMAHIIVEKGKPVLAVAVARDITKRKRLEENLAFLSETSNILASSLDYQKTLWSISQLAVPRIADFCAIDMVNEKGQPELVAGWHKDPKIMKQGIAFRKKYPIDIHAEEGAGKVFRTGKSVLYPTISHDLIMLSARDKGYLHYIEKFHLTSQMTVPLKIQDKVIGVISFASTGEKHFTKSDLSLAEELAKRAALAIENARLFQQSQAAIRARDDFMKMVSHELKTPVTSLKAYVQVMEREFQKKGDTTAFMRVKKMDTQLSSMTRLITELLDLSRIQTGKLVYHKKLFSMDALVRGIVEEMQLTTNHHKILIKGQTNKSVYADRDRIGQVLINLISNAIKFSKEHGRVVVSVKDNDHEITVSVQDFGIGIPKEHQKKVFEQFYQVSDDTRQTFPGLGIGLYLSSDIIKNHHGRISVESSEGNGSTFSFTLPLPKNRKE